MPPKGKKPLASAGRDPDRTRRRILDAALAAFAAGGYAGARVNKIARRADVNKRMLYHYFEDKKGLFRAVLRYKIGERLSRVEAQAPNDLVSSVPVWFKHNCQDADWVRLLAWESLQSAHDAVLDEKSAAASRAKAVVRIRQKQKAGRLRADVPAHFLQLAKLSLSMFPMALPQMARIITGRSPHDPKFQREYARFLETISAGFRPSNGTAKYEPSN